MLKDGQPIPTQPRAVASTNLLATPRPRQGGEREGEFLLSRSEARSSWSVSSCRAPACDRTAV